MAQTKVTHNIENTQIALDAAEIPNLDASKITTGELANARIADLPTSKVTSGTFADARISSGSVTQHVAATDLQPIKSDITAVALREATNESSAAFNLPNQYIDTFATDVLGTKTDVQLSSGHVASAGSTTITLSAATNLFNNSNTTGSAAYTASTGTAANWFDGDGASSAGSVGASGIVGFPQNAVLDFGSGNAFVLNQVGIWSYTDGNGPYWGSFTFAGSNDNSSYTTLKTHSGALGQYTAYEKYTFTNTTAYRYYKVNCTDNAGGYANEIYLRDVAGYNTNGTDVTTTFNNATGTAIQNTNTVGSAKTKVGGTMLYKDLSGTATLGTDLKIYFTCNGGTNWTEASSYSAITPLYSTGVKQVRLGETTCTSGTDIRWKAEWANQANGSKVTQLHGIGINY